MKKLEQVIDENFPLYNSQEFKGQVLQSYQIPNTMDFIRLHYILCFELNTISYLITQDREQEVIFEGNDAYLALEKFNKITKKMI